MKQAKRIIALLLALVMVVGMAPAIAAVDGDVNDPNYPVFPNPGAIGLKKTAQAVSGQGNTWEITLTIDGKNYPTTSDVVLVIDRSNSMDDYGRMEDTKKAAKAFGAQLLQDGNTRIAIVTYERTATLVNGGQFYGQGDLEAFNQAIDSISTNGGTNQQAGIHAAQELLESPTSTGTRKNIVILSDGEPTYSYPFTVTADYVGCTSSHSGWSSSRPSGGALENYQFAANYNKVIGSGSDFELPDYFLYSIRNASVTAQCEHGETYTADGFAFLDENGQLIYSESGPSNNGVATIWEANQSKAKGTTIFSVALQAGTNGESVLQSCATDPINGYFAIGQNDDIGTALQNAFTQIAGQMAIAASDGVVTDPMSKYVDLQIQGASVVTTGDLATFTAGSADIYINQGTVTYDPVTETITWNAGDIQENRQAVLKYRVTLDPASGYPTVGTFPTNEETTFDYTNYLGHDATKNFRIPQVAVDRGTILVHWYQVDADGNPVNVNGEFVETPAQAHQFADPVYFAVDGSTALNFTTYEVPHTYGGNNPDGYAYMGYFLNDENAITYEEETASVTITSTQTSQEVWFAYCPGFTVVHVQKGEEASREVYPLQDNFNLTAVVSDGYLYGGAFDALACDKDDVQVFAAGESALSFTPETNATYYIWEVGEAYLQPMGIYVWRPDYTQTPTNYDVIGFYPVTAIDRLLYQEVGFLVDGVEASGTPISAGDEMAYKKILLKQGDSTREATAQAMFGLDGYLSSFSLDSFKTYTDGAAEGTVSQFTTLPYWITLDGIKVTGAKVRTSSYYGAGTTDDYKTVGAEYTPAKPTCSLAQPSTTPLMLQSVFTASAPEEAPATPVTPETQVTLTLVDGNTTQELTVEPGNLTGTVAYEGQSGKIFAGWYTDPAYTVPADFSNVQENMTVYAKYVDDSYLTVEYTQIRLFVVTGMTLYSAVDGGQYQEAGFLVSRNGQTETIPASSFTQRYGFHTPRSLFGSGVGSNARLMYKSYSLLGLTNGTKLTITPYVVTMDGTTVTGTPRTLTYTRFGLQG